MTGEGEAYRELALLYDELVGLTAFECWRENFERLVNRNGVRYELAADVACGTGLAAAYLASRCRRVYAVDASGSMLEVAARRCPPEKVTLLRQSFTELALPEPVDLLTCNFDSLNYLTDEEDLSEAFARFAASLRGGGWAVFDMNTVAELSSGTGDPVMVHRLSAGYSVWESSWDPETRTNTLLMTNFVERDDGLYEISEEVHRERAYDATFIEEALRSAGFVTVEYSDAKGLSAVGPDTRRVQFLARRGT